MAAFLVWGGTIGGAFIAGRAIGSESGTPTSMAFQAQCQPGDVSGPFRPGQGATGGTGGLFRSGQGTRGTIEGNTLTLSTPQGPLKVAVKVGTIIQKSFRGAIWELPVGMSMIVMGQRAADGTLQTEVVLPARLALVGRPSHRHCSHQTIRAGVRENTNTQAARQE